MPNTALVSPGGLSPVFIALIVFFAVLLGSAVTLWAYFGPTVFYEMIVAGLAYCF